MTAVCFVLAPGQNHFFVEVAEALSYELRQLGVAAGISRDGFPPPRHGLAYVLIPPHEFRGLAPPEHWPTRRQLERTLLYSFEQPGTKFFDANVELAKGPVGAVVDLNPDAVEEYRRQGVRAHHAPLGWTRAWTFAAPGAASAGTRDIDLLHLGIHSPRRGAALAAAADRLARWRTALVLGDDHAPNSIAQANFAIDRDKWELLARSRILLNIHVGERPYFEWLRVVQAICNGVFVVSEESTGTAPLIAGEHFASGAPEDLVRRAEPYLQDEGRRAAAARDAFAVLRDELPFRASAQLVAELAADVAHHRQGTGGGDAPMAWPDNSGIRAEVRAAAAAAAEEATVAAAREASFGFSTGEPVLLSEPRVELLPNHVDRLSEALDDDPAAAFAWGMAADDGAPPQLCNVFPWQPWRLTQGDYIERPVLWRAAALDALGVEPDAAIAEPARDGDLYRRAAERGMYGIHVPEIVARRRSPDRAPAG